VSVKPLVVDLDGTLIKTDLLFETANRFVTTHPFQLPRLIGWLIAGKATMKAHLANAIEIDPASLPYNDTLIEWLRLQKMQGRQLILATASHRQLAEAVAWHLELFDEVLATEGETNLKSHHKRDLLVNHFGEGGFDYVGNDHADLPVWQAANRAYVVSSSPSLIAKASAPSNVEQVFDAGRPSFARTLFKAMRLHQWMKNLLVFVPLLAAHRYGDETSILQALVAFLVFGLTASSVYLLNDLVDVADDRLHPRKRRRPFASGNLSLLHGWLAWPCSLILAFVIASLALSPKFIAVLATYFVLTLAYSLGLKRRAMVDVLTLAALYTLRIIAGAAAVVVPLSFWLLTFSMFMFLSLAFIKRFSELKLARDKGNAGNLHGRGYRHEDLEAVSSMGIASGYLAVLVLALYIQDSHTALLYHTPKFIWLACPLVLYWISRIWLITHRGEMHDDPIVFALRDTRSWLVAVGFVIVFALARVVK
jgi:4-hydroxybenzoate polyprenyltransferase